LSAWRGTDLVSLNAVESAFSPMPTTVVDPPRRVEDHAVRMVSDRPTHSIA